MDLAAISRDIGRAIADADAHGAAEAATVLRHQVTELLRVVRLPPASDCARCEYHPHPVLPSQSHA